MNSVLFYLFAGIMLLFAVAVVANRNPVSSALSLVMSFLGLAALFVQLEAFFIAVVQVLVYAGAVMVLFLFIIMLLDLKSEKQRKLNLPAIGGGVFLVVAFVGQLWFVLSQFEDGKRGFVLLDKTGAAEARSEGVDADLVAADPAIRALSENRLPDVRLVGETLFTQYNFHLQIVGILLLVSTIGVVILSKRTLT